MSRRPAPIKVAVVAPSLGILGGQAIQADRLLRAWKGDDDVQAWLVPVNPDLPRGLAVVKRVKYLRTIATQMAYLPTLRRELARADVVHVFSASYSSFLLAPLPALIAAKSLGKPVLLNYRSGEAPDHLRRSRLARRALASADRNVVPSHFLVDVFRTFDIDATIVPNFVDLDRFRYRERTPLRPHLLSTRNFEGLYDIATTLRAFRIVQDAHPEATLTLVGGGQEDSRLRALAASLGLQRVRFAGQARPDDMSEHYASHDIYVQSPTIDNTPTSVLEAFASGLPVVSTDAGGVPVLVPHNRLGLLAPVGDHAALADRVLHLLANPDAAQRMARAAHLMSQTRSWPALRAQWLEIYRDLAGRPRLAGRSAA